MSRFERVDRRVFLGSAVGAVASGISARRALAQSRTAPAAPETGRWQIGCFTRPWDRHDYRVALDAIAEAGFRYAGLMTHTGKSGRLVISVRTTPDEAQEIGREVKKRGLAIPCVYGGEFPVQKSLNAGIGGLRRLIDNCAAAGSASLMVGGTGSAALYDAYYRAIAECCDYAAERKVLLVTKPHGGLNATGPQCRKALEKVGHGNFRLWYDPGNILYYSDGDLDPVDDLHAVDGLVAGMCIKDFTMSEKDGKMAKDVALTPGSGGVDFPAVVAGLQKGGFTRGPVVIECLARGDLPFLLNEAKRTKEFVERLFS
jgi:sugar phosphate isomerase/epimerase